LRQSRHDFSVYICVNQPDEWWKVPGKRHICEANRDTLRFLKEYSGLTLNVIDHCTPGNGWKGKKHGVGWARKTLMDAIDRVAGPKDIILSLDADTAFKENYFSSVAETFLAHPKKEVRKWMFKPSHRLHHKLRRPWRNENYLFSTFADDSTANDSVGWMCHKSVLPLLG